jgi:hypothetical protein
MVFTYVNPAVAVAGGVLVLGEPFTVTIAAAFVLILAGCVLATASRRGQSDRPEPHQPGGPYAEPLAQLDQRQADQGQADQGQADQDQADQPAQRQSAAAPRAASADPDHAAAG